MNTQYRDNNYFNTEDYFVFDVGWRKFLSKVELYNGYYYTLESLQYKATTLLCVKFSSTNVEKDGFKGVAVKCLPPFDFGVVWNQGQKDLPHYFWNNLNTLKDAV